MHRVGNRSRDNNVEGFREFILQHWETGQYKNKRAKGQKPGKRSWERGWDIKTWWFGRAVWSGRKREQRKENDIPKGLKFLLCECFNDLKKVDGTSTSHAGSLHP